MDNTDSISQPGVDPSQWSDHRVTHREIHDRFGMFDDFEVPEDTPGNDPANPEFGSLDGAIEEASEDEPSSMSDDSDDSDDMVDEAIDHKSSKLGEGEKKGATTEGADFLESLSLPHSVSSLESLRYHPKHGLVKAEANLKTEKRTVLELREQKHRIKVLLKESRERVRDNRQAVYLAKEAFKGVQNTLGISDELWNEYKAFCESLEPKFGSRSGWSVTCFENHGGCYVKWDPELSLFKESADMSLTNCNFRCEAVLYAPKLSRSRDEIHETEDGGELPRDVSQSGSLWWDHLGVSNEYVVYFWPIPAPKPRTGTEKTWGEQYVSSRSQWRIKTWTQTNTDNWRQPELYRLATKALYDLTRANVEPASQLLKALPDPKASFSGGWLFDYCLEPGRQDDPVRGRHWSYRSAHKIDTTGHDGNESEVASFVVSSDEDSDMGSLAVHAGEEILSDAEGMDVDEERH